jgi:hypothetical protein
LQHTSFPLVQADLLQESPHEHQQSVLLSRIITNVVCLPDIDWMSLVELSKANIDTGEIERSCHGDEQGFAGLFR